MQAGAWVDVAKCGQGRGLAARLKLLKLLKHPQSQSPNTGATLRIVLARFFATPISPSRLLHFVHRCPAAHNAAVDPGLKAVAARRPIAPLEPPKKPDPAPSSKRERESIAFPSPAAALSLSDSLAVSARATALAAASGLQQLHRMDLSLLRWCGSVGMASLLEHARLLLPPPPAAHGLRNSRQKGRYEIRCRFVRLMACWRVPLPWHSMIKPLLTFRKEILAAQAR